MHLFFKVWAWWYYFGCGVFPFLWPWCRPFQSRILELREGPMYIGGLLGSNRILISLFLRQQCCRDTVAQVAHPQVEQFLFSQVGQANTEGRSCAGGASWPCYWASHFQLREKWAGVQRRRFAHWVFDHWSRERVAGGQGGRGPRARRLRGVYVGVFPELRWKGQRSGRVAEHDSVLAGRLNDQSAVPNAAEPPKVIRRRGTSSIRLSCMEDIFVQTIVFALWVTRSQLRHSYATQARISFVFSGYKLFLLLSLRIPGSLVAVLAKKSQHWRFDRIERFALLGLDHGGRVKRNRQLVSQPLSFSDSSSGSAQSPWCAESEARFHLPLHTSQAPNFGFSVFFHVWTAHTEWLYSTVKHSTCLGFLVCSDPKPCLSGVLWVHTLGGHQQHVQPRTLETFQGQ